MAAQADPRALTSRAASATHGDLARIIAKAGTAQPPPGNELPDH